jgi:hypothetical protein
LPKKDFTQGEFLRERILNPIKGNYIQLPPLMFSLGTTPRCVLRLHEKQMVFFGNGRFESYTYLNKEYLTVWCSI